MRCSTSPQNARLCAARPSSARRSCATAASHLGSARQVSDSASHRVKQTTKFADVSMDEFLARGASACSSAWTSYQEAIKTSPIKTKALTSFVGLIISDCIAQASDSSGAAYDLLRTARMATFGILWHGAAGHFWYKLLDQVILPNKPKSAWTIVCKTVADQAIWSPVNTVIFYASLAAMEGHAYRIPTILDEKLLSTVIAGYALWPLAHVINFKFVPSQHRLLYVNIINLFWTVYLSKVANAGPTLELQHSPAMSTMTPIPVSNSVPVLDFGHVVPMDI